jgi:hypothetical protein
MRVDWRILARERDVDAREGLPLRRAEREPVVPVVAHGQRREMAQASPSRIASAPWVA